MEADPHLASWLRQVPFMRNLPAVYRHELAAICYPKRYDAGDEILEQGDLTDRFFIVAEGHVHFRKTDAQKMEHSAGNARAGQHFGAAMFTTQELSEYNVEALTDTTVYVMERQAFDRLVLAQPTILKAMPEIEAKRRRLTRGFKWLTPGEEVVLTTHRHKFALILGVLPPIGVGLVLGLILLAVYNFRFVANTTLLQAAGGILFLLVLAWLALSAIDWANDDLVVTNKRVGHAERVILTSELRNEIPISKIQSITVRKSGPLDSLLGVSTLEVQSAGREGGGIVFDRVANAEWIRQKIEEQRGRLRALEQAIQRKRFLEHVSSKLTHQIYGISAEAQGEPPKPRQKRSILESWRSVWNRMFGHEFREGNTITWRKHWVALLRQAGRFVLFFIVLVVALAVYLAVPILSILPRVPTLAVFGFLLVIALGGLAYQWEDWRNDIYRVTDTQIMDIERLPFGFMSRSTEALLTNVQDARSMRPHPLNAILDFGNVEIQTAGGGTPLIFYDVTRPEEIVEEIFRRMEKRRVMIMDREIVLQSQNVANAIAKYHHLVQKGKAPGTEETTPEGTGNHLSGQGQLPPGTSGAGAQGSGITSPSVVEPPISQAPRDKVSREFTFIENGEDL